MRTLDTLEVNVVSGGNYAECVSTNFLQGALAGGIASAIVFSLPAVPIGAAFGGLLGTAYGVLTC